MKINYNKNERLKVGYKIYCNRTILRANKNNFTIDKEKQLNS